MQKVMSMCILKITGLSIFVLAVIIGVYVLWPAKSPDVRQIPQQDASTSTIQPNIEKPQPKQQLTPEDFQPAATSRLQDQNPREQELRQRAALLSSIYRNPDSPEAAKARELLLKRPQTPHKQFGPARKGNKFEFLNVPRGKKINEIAFRLRRTSLPRNDILRFGHLDIRILRLFRISIFDIRI